MGGTKTAAPSSNWLALRKRLTTDSESSGRPPKRRKVSTTIVQNAAAESSTSVPSQPEWKSTLGDTVLELQALIRGEWDPLLSETQKLPGKYLAMDCEMVGVGPNGTESSLARVSLVNFNGAIQLDEFVRQRELVTDWRTAVSGIRDVDMIKAKPFGEVQKLVADLLKNRILVGHAVHNDLHALLLKHPRPMTRDTQKLAAKEKLLGNSRFPGLRRLIEKEFQIQIQSGEHSSVTDARATIALFRLYRKQWEKISGPAPPASSAHAKPSKPVATNADVEPEEDSLFIKPKPSKKRKHDASEKSRDTYPGGGRKGISSGLSTVIKRRTSGAANSQAEKSKWWEGLPNSGPMSGGKGTLRIGRKSI
ncbi:ribonuclease H-like protein [Sistotremastrum niveocremeum HHB9708]|uniref:RNA exonuclease 4 n=1 Tax=Sistotremastrum niveocremeum HHB9708 TaxID=1314777 RepID=A0A164NKS0_9AGAM|nr:ribonuclease H-like protein [Sistotremastrum niveocremeum HHB9708]